MNKEKEIKSLTECRKKIDEIDNKIITLFKERMKISEDIAKYKLAHNLPILDEKREAEKIKAVRDLAGKDMAEDCELMYNIIINSSKKHQKR